MQWVHQEHPEGCGVACLAMLTGQTWDQVAPDFERALADPEKRGVKPYEMAAYLCDLGYFLRTVRLREHAPRGVWPPLPFAPMHYLMVDSPTQPTGHWVVMDGFGRCLDPWDPSRNGWPSSFYRVCHEAVGVMRVSGPPMNRSPRLLDHPNGV